MGSFISKDMNPIMPCIALTSLRTRPTSDNVNWVCRETQLLNSAPNRKTAAIPRGQTLASILELATNWNNSESRELGELLEGLSLTPQTRKSGSVRREAAVEPYVGIEDEPATSAILVACKGRRLHYLQDWKCLQSGNQDDTTPPAFTLYAEESIKYKAAIATSVFDKCIGNWLGRKATSILKCTLKMLV